MLIFLLLHIIYRCTEEKLIEIIQKKLSHGKAMETFDNLDQRWAWNWTVLCGLHGSLTPLNPDTNDLGLCFQQLCLQVMKYLF